MYTQYLKTLFLIREPNKNVAVEPTGSKESWIYCLDNVGIEQ